jgi:hypothetical protein
MMRLGAKCSPVGPTQGPWTTRVKKQNYQDIKNNIVLTIALNLSLQKLQKKKTNIVLPTHNKQARKGFRPISVIQNFLDIF